MRLAVLAESEADEDVLRLLVEAILKRPTAAIGHYQLRSRGWPSVLQVLPSVFRNIYFETDADALVVLADSNHSAPHWSTLDTSQQPDAKKCRVCRMSATIDAIRPRTVGRPERAPLKTAIGVCTPAIEGWLRIGLNPHVGEADWVRGLQENRFPYTTDELKEQVYGHARAPGSIIRRRALEEARRIVDDPALLQLLEVRFPGGFGSMATEIRTW